MLKIQKNTSFIGIDACYSKFYSRQMNHPKSISYGPLSDELGYDFARKLFTAWNSHDVEKTMEFYAEDLIMILSSTINALRDNNNIVIGKSEFEDFCKCLLNKQPDLKFTVLAIAAGLRSLTIHYSSTDGKIISDILEFNSDNKIIKAQNFGLLTHNLSVN